MENTRRNHRQNILITTLEGAPSIQMTNRAFFRKVKQVWILVFHWRWNCQIKLNYLFDYQNEHRIPIYTGEDLHHFASKMRNMQPAGKSGRLPERR